MFITNPKQCLTKNKVFGFALFGGPEEIRTPDPYNANVMRSQLRYGPMDYRDIIAPEQPLVKFFLPFFQKTWYDVGQTTPKE